jgi:DNA (cytosine-5)-methyltransferase 1
LARPRLLDLFCGAGGAAMGYHRAGFDVVGVDIVPQPRYPFEFVQADALGYPLHGFDYVHASPPCQRWAAPTRDREAWPDLIGPLRERLRSFGIPYVMENVPRAPLRFPITLCGTMFEGLRVIRHRAFESSALLLLPQPCGPHPHVYQPDKRRPHLAALDPWTDFVYVTGGGNCSRDQAADAMGIDWPMTKHELNEAIPPAFSELIGTQLLMTVAYPAVAL